MLLVFYHFFTQNFNMDPVISAEPYKIIFYTPNQPFIHSDPLLERVATACMPFIACSLSEMGVLLRTCVWNSAFLGLNQTFLWIFWQFAYRLTVKNFLKKVWFRLKKPGFQTRVRKNTPISARLQPKRPASAAPLFKTGSKFIIDLFGV